MPSMRRALGHARVDSASKHPNCHYSRYEFPEWLLAEDPELIDEVLDWDGDDDDDGHDKVPVNK